MPKKNPNLYKQEAPSGIYQMIWPFLSASRGMKKHFYRHYGPIWCYFKDNYAVALLLQDKMDLAAKVVFKMHQNKELKKLIAKWRQIDKKNTKLAQKIHQLNLKELKIRDIERFYNEVKKRHQEMWDMSIFIDVLDAGFDQRIINKVRTEYGLSPKEVEILLGPAQLSYLKLAEIDLCKVRTGKINPAKFISRYFWLNTSYEKFSELSEKQVVQLSKKASFQTKPSIKGQYVKILKKYGIKRNPLSLLQLLAQWRDERKRLNLSGLYGLMKLLSAISRRENVNPGLMNFIFPDEIEKFFRDGCLPLGELEKRKKQPALVEFKNGSYSYVLGKKAEHSFAFLARNLETGKKQEISGMVAHRGAARGRVKITLNPDKERRKMKKGDILVSVMTRPEFAPLMKKAAAIVTDEGGISSHAAIVSRELGIPCIIGTKIATKVLKDGDMVEVDADKGIVKLLKRK